MRTLPKSSSTQNIKGKKGGLGASISSLKNTQSNFKFRQPYFSPLHKLSEEQEKSSEKFLEKWSEIRTLSPPKRRSFQTSCIYDNYLYIFGGKDITEGKLCDIFRIQLNKEEKNPKWENITPSNGVNLESLAYHTGTLIEDKYYIIGGNDKFIRQSSFIYIYNLKNNELEKIKIEKNEDICYLSMHTANYYEPKKEIILFGGYSEGEMLNTIYKFNIETKEITKIEYGESDTNNIPSPRTGHGSFIINNYLYIFGGSIKDGSLLNDLWKLDIENIKWEKIEDNNKEQNNNQDQNNNENNNTSPNNELLIPSPRSGHSIILLNDKSKIYIFGGKVGNFQEGNDLWEYEIGANKFSLLHDTMLEQFTDEEIEEFKKEENKKKKKKGSDFHFISKKELDDKVNPFSKLYTENRNMNRKFLFKSQSTKDINKNDYENEIFVNPGYYQMKHSSIFNLDSKDVNSAIFTLDNLLPYKVGDKGPKLPLPRDGASIEFYDNKLFIFGGDRNKYPFNDLYFFDLSG